VLANEVTKSEYSHIWKVIRTNREELIYGFKYLKREEEEGKAKAELSFSDWLISKRARGE